MSERYDTVFEEHRELWTVQPQSEGGEPVSAASQSWSQEEILEAAEAGEAALASLTEAGIPPDDDGPDRWTDPDCDRPDELADLMTPELEQLIAEGPAPVPEFGPAGFLPRDGSGRGAGFADGGVLDVLAPGVSLAGFADDAHRRLADTDDDSLIGVLRGWRRLAAWAQARELATITELARRRPAGGAPPAAPGAFPARMSEFIADEVALALTLTARSAEAELGLALDLAGRPATFAALETGRIDLPRAKIIAEGVSTLEADHADTVEAAVLPRAPGLTTGQLRAAVARAVLAVDPQAARRRREDSEKSARVDCWPEPCGTASLAGWHLPSAQALAADKRLCQIATAWRRQGATGETDLLRARAYLALLLGLPIDAPPADLLPPGLADPPVPADPAPDPAPGSPAPGPGSTARAAGSPAAGPGSTRRAAGSPAAGPGSTPCAAGSPAAGPGSTRRAVGSPAAGPGSTLPPLAGTVNLTVPLTTLLGLTEAPGQAAGYGPLDAGTARMLACAVAGHRATRWQITVTAPDGTALAHGTAPGRTRVSASGPEGNRPQGSGPTARNWTVAVTAEPVATGSCDHRHCEPGYRPSPRLQRLVRARASTCTAPGCRRPATTCDLDHTRGYDDDGWTCECNLAPLCRHHHRVKQTEGWQLRQPSPGVMAWTTPAGRRYTTLPSRHPT
jgi:hypothetical protein